MLCLNVNNNRLIAMHDLNSLHDFDGVSLSFENIDKSMDDECDSFLVRAFLSFDALFAIVCYFLSFKSRRKFFFSSDEYSYCFERISFNNILLVSRWVDRTKDKNDVIAIDLEEL